MALIAWTSQYLADQGYTSSDQTRVEACITSAQKAMEKYCKRSFESAEYTKQFRVKNDGFIFLDAFPCDWVGRVLSNQEIAITVTSTATNPAISTADTALKLIYYSSGARQNQSLTYASNVTMTALATAISAVSGFSATAKSPYTSFPSSDLISGQTYTPTANLLLWCEDTGTQYDCDLPRGVIRVQGIVNKPVKVTWTGGFTSIPEDLQRVCAELAKNTFNAIKGNEISENLGPYSYMLSGSGSSRLPLTVRKILELYRDRRV